MTTSPALYPAAETERDFLEGLRKRYAAQGYSFVIEPRPNELPAFLGSYRPDAIASKPGSKLAIQVKSHADPAAEPSLKEIRRLFEGQPDWQFVVTYMGSDPLKTLTIPPSSTANVRRRVGEVRALAAEGQHRAAFVMAWSVLEAALHRIAGEKDSRPRTPGTVVQTLATLGYLEPALETRLRPLIVLRNRIVHGDLAAEPTPDDTHTVLTAVEQTLTDDAAQH